MALSVVILHSHMAVTEKGDVHLYELWLRNILFWGEFYFLFLFPWGRNCHVTGRESKNSRHEKHNMHVFDQCYLFSDIVGVGYTGTFFWIILDSDMNLSFLDGCVWVSGERKKCFLKKVHWSGFAAQNRFHQNSPKLHLWTDLHNSDCKWKILDDTTILYSLFTFFMPMTSYYDVIKSLKIQNRLWRHKICHRSRIAKY